MFKVQPGLRIVYKCGLTINDPLSHILQMLRCSVVLQVLMLIFVIMLSTVLGFWTMIMLKGSF